MEKIHGTSAHIGLDNDLNVKLFSGGEKHANFVAAVCGEFYKKFPDEFEVTGFDTDVILNFIQDKLRYYGQIVIYGEAYGGKCQGMSKTYGTQLKFIAFDVKIGDSWLSVPKAHKICEELGIEFVDYVEIPAELAAIDAERDKPSTQAIRNGMGDGHIREGVILRPLEEYTKNNGKRVIVKHKRKEFSETKTEREVDPTKLAVLSDAKAVAEEWVTPMRLAHILDKIDSPELPLDMTHTPQVIKAMIADVEREGEGEIVWSKEVRTAMGSRTASLFKQHFENALRALENA